MGFPAAMATGKSALIGLFGAHDKVSAGGIRRATDASLIGFLAVQMAQ